LPDYGLDDLILPYCLDNFSRLLHIGTGKRSGNMRDLQVSGAGDANTWTLAGTGHALCWHIPNI
jgi:hypothetical protein